MSSKARLIRSHFTILYTQHLPAWKALKAEHGKQEDHFSSIKVARNLVELLAYNGFESAVNEHGDIIDLVYGDDLNDYHLEEFFLVLSPYVEHGSTLRFLSEYMTIDEYHFHDGRVDMTSKEL